MYTTESLKVLVNIANSQKLRSFLQHVYIITASFSDRNLNCSHGACCCWKASVRQREAYAYYLKDQENLRKTKGDQAYLTEAFCKLPKLYKLTLLDDPTDLPDDVDCRGLNKVIRTTANRPSFIPKESLGIDDDYLSWLNHVWRMLMAAVAKSGQTSFTSIETMSKSNLYGLSPIRDFKFSPETVEKLSTAFANVKTFKIMFRSQNMRKDREDSLGDIGLATKRIKAFLPAMHAANEYYFSFDNYESSGSVCKAVLNVLDTSKVKTLKLDNICMDAKPLASSLARFRNLELLTLSFIDLSNGTWITVLKILQKLPLLYHLHLLFLQQEQQKVYFIEQLDNLVDVNNDDFAPGVGNEASDEGGNEDEDHGDGDIDTDLDKWSEVDEAQPEDGETVEEDIPLSSPSRKRCSLYTGPDFKSPHHEHSPERGYYICLETREDIDHYLPIFMKECEIGGLAGIDLSLGGLFGAAGMIAMPVGGQPGGPGAGGGVGIPGGGVGGPGAGAGAAVGVGGAAGVGAAAGAAGGNGAPPGGVSVLQALNALLGPLPPYAAATGAVPPSTQNAAGPGGIATPNNPAAGAAGVLPAAQALPFGQPPTSAVTDTAVPDAWMNDDTNWVDEMD